MAAQNKAKTLLLEVALASIALIMVLVTVIGIVGTAIFMLAYPILRERVFSFMKWVLSVWKMLFKHFAYVCKYVFLPTFRQAAKSARRHTQQLRQKVDLGNSIDRAHRSIDKVWRDNSAIVDAEMVWYVLWQMLPYTVHIPHLIVVLIGTVMSFAAGYTYYGPATVKTEPTPIVKPTYEPQIADVQEETYGPWYKQGEVSHKLADPSFQNIALLSDTGTAQYAKAYTASLEPFYKTPGGHQRVINPRKIDTGQIEFSDQHGNTFRVNPNQVFMFENYKTKVFGFDSNGVLFTLPSSKLKAVNIQD